MRCLLGVSGGGLILGAVALYLMSFGVLVRSEVRKAAAIGTGADVLACHYFVGTEVAPIEFWHSIRSVCPRLYRF